MAAMRVLLAALVAVLAIPFPAAAQDPAEAIQGTWEITFTPTSVRSVGTRFDRDGEIDCGAPSCGAAYRFTEREGEPMGVFVRFDGLRAPAAPQRFGGPVTFDGGTYRVVGKYFYPTAFTVDAFLPDDLDTLTFTVSGPPDDPVLSGEMTAVLAYTGPTGKDGEYLDVTGYEVYSGTATGRLTPDSRLARRAGSGSGASAGAGSGGAGSSSVAAPAARADDAAYRAHSRPVLSTRVATARQLPWAPSSVAVSALLALLLVLLMPFPAALFNSTLEANYAEVSGWFAFLRRGSREPGQQLLSGWRGFAVLVGAVAVLNAFLDPGLGADRATLVLVAGLALSVAAVSLLSSLPSRLYHARRYGERAAVALFPLGLAVAAVCVVISRVTSFEPGYLYGVVAGFAFAGSLSRGERGRITVATSVLLLATAVAAFVARIPVHDAVLDGRGVPLQLLDTVLAAVFAAGIEANVLGLLPVRFLPGEELFAWSRVAWAAIFGVNVFAFLHALSAAAGGASTGESVTVAAALFLAFGTVSVAFWAWFRFRRQSPPRAATS
jgi:hypothetical protein